MRTFFTVTVIAFAMGLCASELLAAPATIAATQRDLAPLTRLVQGVDRYDSTNGYLLACPYGVHYYCYYGPYGTRHCGCWLSGDRPACPAGFYYSCPSDSSGNRHCACW